MQHGRKNKYMLGFVWCAVWKMTTINIEWQNGGGKIIY